MNSKELRRGGHFLVHHPGPDQVFIREDFGEEQRMMFQAAADFMKSEVEPHLQRFEQGDYGLVEDLLHKAGNLGLLGLSVPEEFGGMGMGFNVSMLICEEISSMTGSLATAFGAHTGIGTLPIQYYGSQAIKDRFLAKIASGEWISCYNLTEPGAGSDANSGKTMAVLSSDGQHYEITGQKIWISNAGFAQVFIVFARIEDDKNISCFVFHKDDVQGLTMNAEEHKMGIKSSSTRQVFYDKVRVPADSMLGQRGDGFKIAVNVLNAGRIKLAAATNGAAFKVIGLMSRYANERQQFGKKIGEFGAIQEKIARCSALVYATDAALYRAGDAIEKLRTISLHIDESAGLTSSELRANARRLSRQCGKLGLIVVDYLQLMSGSSNDGENRATELGEISRGLKTLAKELSASFHLVDITKEKQVAETTLTDGAAVTETTDSTIKPSESPATSPATSPAVKPTTAVKKPEYSYASKVPGKEGFVFSPYNNKVVDVRDIPSGTLVQDPTYPAAEKKYVRVP